MVYTDLTTACTLLLSTGFCYNIHRHSSNLYTVLWYCMQLYVIVNSCIHCVQLYRAATLLHIGIFFNTAPLTCTALLLHTTPLLLTSPTTSKLVCRQLSCLQHSDNCNIRTSIWHPLLNNIGNTIKTISAQLCEQHLRQYCIICTTVYRRSV